MNIKKYNVVGIDPDVDKSGVCFINSKKELIVQSLRIPQLLMYLLNLHARLPLVEVHVEASYLIQSNWHLSRNEGRRVAASKGHRVGRNHQVAYTIVEWCNYHGIKVIERLPLQKIWKGKDRKITHEEIVKNTGYSANRSNQEERDAILIAITA